MCGVVHVCTAVEWSNLSDLRIAKGGGVVAVLIICRYAVYRHRRDVTATDAFVGVGGRTQA